MHAGDLFYRRLSVADPVNYFTIVPPVAAACARIAVIIPFSATRSNPSRTPFGKIKRPFLKVIEGTQLRLARPKSILSQRWSSITMS